MAKLILEVDPTRMVTGASKGEAALEGVAREAQRTESAVDRVTAGMGRAGTSMNVASTRLQRAGGQFSAMRGQIQNASYQLGDFAVQVGAGTSATIALGQQLPQLLGGFGALGAVMGAVVAIGVPLAAAFFNAGSAAETAKDKAETLKQVLQSIDKTAQATGASVDRYITSTFRESAAEVTALVAALRTAEFEKSQRKLKASLNDTKVSVDKLVNAWEILVFDVQKPLTDTVGKAYINDLEKAVVASQLTFNEVSKLQAAMEKVGTSSDMDAFVANLSDAYALAEELGGPTATKVQDGLRGMAEEAGVLERILASAASNASSIAAEMSDADYNLFLKYDAYGESRRAAPDAPPKVRKVRSGGGSRIDTTLSSYQSLISSLDPLTAASIQFEKAQTTINAALDKGHISATEAARAYTLAGNRFRELTAKAKESSSVWDSLKATGASALDKLIQGTISLKDALRDMIKELIVAIAKKQLLSTFEGGSASDSLGSLFFKSIFGGFKDAGGMVPTGKTAVVGERGPEIIRATTQGAMVTSRGETSRQLGGGQSIVVAPVLNVSVGVAQTVRTEMAGLLPELSQQMKNVVADAIKRQEIRV